VKHSEGTRVYGTEKDAFSNRKHCHKETVHIGIYLLPRRVLTRTLQKSSLFKPVVLEETWI